MHEHYESWNDTHIHVTKHDVKISIDGNLLDPVKRNSWMLRIISFSTTNVTIARDGFFFFIRHAILDFDEFCKIEVRHTLKRKKSFFVFSFQTVSHCVIIS